MCPRGQPGCPHPQVYEGKESAWAGVGPTRPAIWGVGSPGARKLLDSALTAALSWLCCVVVLRSNPPRKGRLKQIES